MGKEGYRAFMLLLETGFLTQTTEGLAPGGTWDAPKWEDGSCPPPDGGAVWQSGELVGGSEWSPGMQPPNTQPPTCSPHLTFVDVAKNVQSWLDPPLHCVQQLHTPYPLHLLGDPVQEACGTDRRVSGTGRAQPKLRQSPVLSTYWGWKDRRAGGGSAT